MERLLGPKKCGDRRVVRRREYQGRKRESSKSKQKGLKLDTEEGVPWGEEVEVEEEEKSRFLYSNQGEKMRGALKQTTIAVMALTGLEWMSRMILTRCRQWTRGS